MWTWITRDGRAARHRNGDGATRPRTPGRSAVPGPRALVGGLLMAIAAVGTFVAWDRAAAGDHAEYVVAARSLPPGTPLTADDLRVVRLDLGAGVGSAAHSNPDQVVGHVLLGPAGEGELIQAAQLGAPRSGLIEVSMALPRDRALDGRVRSGDVVDIFVTEGGLTRPVAEQVQVITASEPGGPAGTPGREIVLTAGLDDPALRDDVVHALRAGDVTLVRSPARPAP